MAIEFCDALKFFSTINYREFRSVTTCLTATFHKYRLAKKLFDNISRRRLRKP